MLTFVTVLEMDNFDCTNIKKMYSFSLGGAHSRVEAYMARPTSPPYVTKQFTVLFHTPPLFTALVHIYVAPTINWVFIKA